MSQPLDVQGMSAEEAADRLTKMERAVSDWREVVSSKRLREDPDAPQAPEWRLANPEIDPEAQAVFDALEVGHSAAASSNGSAHAVEQEPPWVPAEERGKTSEIDAAAVRAELLRVRLLTPAQLAALPPPEPLIGGYLTRDSLAVLYGRPGTAKSFIAISMALAVVTGTPWFGHDVHRGPVLYVAGEGTSGLAQRQRAWQDACEVDDLKGMYWLPFAVNLLQADWSRGLAELAADLGVVLVIIDTLARSMVGGDENKSGDMAQAIEAADEIRRQAGATSLLVHHTPKDGTTPRGHSALEGAVDTGLLLERSEAVFTLTAAKQKDIPQVEPLIFELEPWSGSVVPALKWSHGTIDGIVGAELTLRDVIETMAGTDGLSATGLFGLAKMPRSSFYRALKNLDRRGVIRNVGTPSRPRWVTVEDLSEPIVPMVPNGPMGPFRMVSPQGGSLEPLRDGTNRLELDLEEEF